MRNPSTRHAPATGSAFTLVELLVVISIIALLIAILLPSLKKAREQAKQAACLANVRGIGQASLTYAADDPGENGIPSHPGEDPQDPLFYRTEFSRLTNYAYGGKSGRGLSNAPWESIQQSLYGKAGKANAATRPLNRIIYKTPFKALPRSGGRQGIKWKPDTELDLGLYKCPSDRGFQGNHYNEWAQSKLSSYDHFGTSYAANVFWIGIVGGNCKMESNSPYLRPLSRVPNAANTLLYWENVGRYCWQHKDPCPIAGVGINPQYPEGRGGPKWHTTGWKFNAAFADGHGEVITMKSYNLTDLANLTGTCANASCICIIIRGNGWQIDTLPAATIPTDHICPANGRPSQDGIDMRGPPL